MGIVIANHLEGEWEWELRFSKNEPFTSHSFAIHPSILFRVYVFSTLLFGFSTHGNFG